MYPSSFSDRNLYFKIFSSNQWPIWLPISANAACAACVKSSWRHNLASMGSWRRFDLNLKGVEGIQERTIGGGVVTLLSCCFVAFLLLSELSVWWTVDVAHRMHVDTDSVRSPASSVCS